MAKRYTEAGEAFSLTIRKQRVVSVLIDGQKVYTGERGLQFDQACIELHARRFLLFFFVFFSPPFFAVAFPSKFEGRWQLQDVLECRLFAIGPSIACARIYCRLCSCTAQSDWPDRQTTDRNDTPLRRCCRRCQRLRFRQVMHAPYLSTDSVRHRRRKRRRRREKGKDERRMKKD